MLQHVRGNPISPSDAMDQLAATLLAEGVIDEPGLARARQAAERAGERLDQALVRLGLVPDVAVVRVVSALLGIDLFEEADSDFAAALIEGFPNGFLRRNRILPLRFDNDYAVMALCDPFATDSIAAVCYRLEREASLRLATAAQFERLADSILSPLTVAENAPEHSGEAVEDDVERLKDLASEAPTIRLVNQIIVSAIEDNASDIHFEPDHAGLRVRLRRDGMLQTVETLAPELKAAVISRLKVMAKLDIAERRLPQDGRIRVSARGREIDLRVSTTPALGGESVVLRILDREAAQLDLETLGFSGEPLTRLRRALERPNGMLLVTGPTGSGKTTTLYAALSLLNDPGRKIFTVEDPVEYQLRGIVQMQVQPKIGLDFAAALRSILRQDPDIILIGEIRDGETLKIAIQAALTGHLVLATLHTNSAAASVTRLIDMGAENYLVASTLIGILAQRLVRKFCAACGGKGCPSCRGSGHAGRSVIMEYLDMSPSMRRLVARNAGEDEIAAQAKAEGMIAMIDDGMQKAKDGVTSEREVLRAVSSG